MVLSMEACGQSCWKEAGFVSVISSLIREDETVGYFISFEISLHVPYYPYPWKPKWCFRKGFLHLCAVLPSHLLQGSVVCHGYHAPTVTLSCFGWVMGNDIQIQRFVSTSSCWSKLSSQLHPKIMASQQVIGIGSMLCMSSVQNAALQCDSWRAKWHEVSWCKIEVRDVSREPETGIVWGEKDTCRTWLGSAFLSLASETAELLHVKSHPSSQIIYIYAQIYMCGCMYSLRQTPDMKNVILIHSNLVEI